MTGPLAGENEQIRPMICFLVLGHQEIESEEQ